MSGDRGASLNNYEMYEAISKLLKIVKAPSLRADKGSVFPPSHKAAAGQAVVTFPPPHKATAGQARWQVQTTLYSSLRMTSL